MNKICGEPKCGDKHYAKGMCRRHYHLDYYARSDKPREYYLKNKVRLSETRRRLIARDPEKYKEIERRYRQNNHKKILAYRKRNKKPIAKKAKAKYLGNPGKYLKYSHDYYFAHRNEISTRKALWYQRNKKRLSRKHRADYRRKKKGVVT